jgi:polyhydroxyalkanoate synthase
MRNSADNSLTAAALGAVEGAEAIGVPRLRELWDAGVKTAMHTRGASRRGAQFAAEAVKVVGGRSSIQSDPKDWRFRDPTWTDNPVYRRIMQLYLAAVGEFEGLVADADLEWRDKERAAFLASLITSALAPTNTLLGNPEAIKRAFDTAGGSVRRGMRNFISDLRTNGGLPSQVDRTAFTVGEDLAVTPGAVIYRDDVCEVLQYTPTTPEIRARPTVILPPQIGRYYFMDLRPKRSFVEYAISRGIPVFMTSWRNPGPDQRDWDFDTYGAAALRAIDVAREVTGSEDVNVLGFCAGGILTASVTSHVAQTNDSRINSASFGVTLLDFDVPATIGAFNSGAVLGLAAARSNRQGIITGRSLGAMFALLRPNELVWNYWVNNYLLGNDPPVFDILAWNADSTNLPAKLHGEFLGIFAENKLVEPGALTLLGTPVDLGQITVETYVTGATTDHLTPWKGCYRTTQLTGGGSTFILSNAGHVASLVNPPGNPKAHYFAGPEPVPDPEDWLAKAEKQQGTWWEHWAKWIGERSGEERRAPGSLGSKRHRPIEPAPGSYVRDMKPALSSASAEEPVLSHA